MVEPYAIVALSPRTFTIKNREDALANVKRICNFMDAAVMVGAWEGARARLVVIPEMAIQGLIPNIPGNRAAEAQYAMEIPGPETEALGRKAKQLDAYIAAELYMVKDADFPDRYFNIAFIVSPSGEIVYKRYKATSDAYEGGMLGNANPHDVWDEFIAKKGKGDVMNAIFPVARTEIGNIGIAICHEGVYPEVIRGLAMNVRDDGPPDSDRAIRDVGQVGVAEPGSRDVQSSLCRRPQFGPDNSGRWRRCRPVRR